MKKIEPAYCKCYVDEGIVYLRTEPNGKFFYVWKRSVDHFEIGIAATFDDTNSSMCTKQQFDSVVKEAVALLTRFPA